MVMYHVMRKLTYSIIVIPIYIVAFNKNDTHKTVDEYKYTLSKNILRQTELFNSSHLIT